MGILLTDPNHLLSRRDQKIKSSVNVKERRPRRFWNIANDKTLSQPCSLDLGSTALEWSAWGLDCRHLLASRLPLDVCLAFDDMINEVRNAKRTTSSSLTKGEGKEAEIS